MTDRSMWWQPVRKDLPTDPATLRTCIEVARIDAQFWRGAGDERLALLHEQDEANLRRALERIERCRDPERSGPDPTTPGAS